jgi:apolipoprotein N-acyltransferase
MATGTTYMKNAPAAMTMPAPGLDARQRAGWYSFGLALAGSVLLWMCFQPLGFGAYLGWLAFAPFLILVRSQAKPWFLYMSAFVCGLVFFVPVLAWMRVADRAMIGAWLTLSVYCALYFPAALFCIRRLESWNLPLVLATPLVWVAFEYVRCFLLTGFPWYLLAHTQHDFLSMIQISDLGGVFLVSFLVVAVNAFLFDCAYQFPEVRAWFGQKDLEPYRYYSSLEIANRGVMADWLFRRNLLHEGAILALVLISTYSYGVFRLGQSHFRPGPTVCLLQSNLDQRLRESNDDRSAKKTTEHFTALCMRAAFDHNPRPDILIWPETSYPRPWVEVSRDLPVGEVPDKWRDAEIDVRQALSDLAGEHTQIPHLLGINTHFLDARGKHRRYNSALLLKPVTQPDGKVKGRVEGKFDKIHRVPFGEYVPLVDWLPFLAWLTPYEGDFGIQSGEKLTRFELGPYHFGVLICYEDTDPFMARRYLDKTEDGEPVDFFVNISNDGWFDGSSEHEEHLAVSRFRAIECRRSMVRAVNMGVSAVIDGNGRVLRPREYPNTNPPVWVVEEDPLRPSDMPASEWHKYKKRSGTLTATVPIDQRFSLYACTGDWLPIGCWMGLLSAGGWSVVRRRRALPPVRG